MRCVKPKPRKWERENAPAPTFKRSGGRPCFARRKLRRLVNGRVVWSTCRGEFASSPSIRRTAVNPACPRSATRWSTYLAQPIE